MTNTDKLIQDGLWRDISEAPRGTGEQFLVCDESDLVVMAEAVVGYPNDDPFEIFDVTSCRFGTPTHFRPLPNDRLANALKVAVDALNRIGLYSDLGGKIAGEALTEIERIAGGD